jgi:threonine dehydratase
MEALDALCNGYEVYVKPENLQITGSFKIRGASNKIRSLNNPKGLIAVSSGNHAQGVALAARREGLKAIILMPEIASRYKMQKVKDYGAEVIIHGKNNNESEAYSKTLLEETGYEYIPPYYDPLIMAGQGTIGLEIMEDFPLVDAVICPIGGGGHISGISLAVKTKRPETIVIGVEPALVPRFAESRKKGQPVHLQPEKITIADGTRTDHARPMTFANIEKNVDFLLSVTEEEITGIYRKIIINSKLVIEPSSMMVFAAAHLLPLPKKQKICFVVSGGNIDPETFAGLMKS